MGKEKAPRARPRPGPAKGGEQLELAGTRADMARARAARALAPADRDREIVRALGAWFDAAARDLPWRRQRDPYAVWLSEIMLQQTRVETVVPYFERFLARFPDVRALAAAEIDDVLSLWSGLGYYRRARVLHAAAREVTLRYGGAVPREAADLRALPGIGAYTAGAIASIAYGKREPLVDGNVARVLARVEGIDDPIRSPPAVRALWAAASRLVPEERPGRFNEALMELGATVCTPRDPRCDACPIERLCIARAAGRVAELPVVEAKREVPVILVIAAVISDAAGKILFARRAEGGLFGGLWEPPMIEGAVSLAAAKTQLHALGVGRAAASLREVGRVKHVLTHRQMDVRVAAGAIAAQGRAIDRAAPPYEKAAWLDPEAPGVGVSTLAKKVLRAARDA